MCCHETVLRCWFMVCNMQACPHQGLFLHPCLCHLPSGLPRCPSACAAHPKTCLLFILPKFSHVFPIFPWPDSDPGAGVYGCGGIHPPRFPGNDPDIHANPCSEFCQLTAAWQSFSLHRSVYRYTLSELNYGLVTFLPLPVFCYWQKYQHINFS